MTVFWFSLFLISFGFAVREWMQVRRLSRSVDMPEWDSLYPILIEMEKAWGNFQQCARMSSSVEVNQKRWPDATEVLPSGEDVVLDCRLPQHKFSWKTPDGEWESRILADGIPTVAAITQLCRSEKEVARRRLLRLVMEIREV